MRVQFGGVFLKKADTGIPLKPWPFKMDNYEKAMD